MTRDDASNLVSSLFDTWYVSVVRYAGRLCENSDFAQDIVQEAFIELYRNLAKGTGIQFPKAWMLCVVRRIALREMRRYRLDSFYESLDMLDSTPVGWVDADVAGLEYDEISRMFSRLTPREQEVLLLRMEALKYREIGAQLGISANSVNTLLVRAIHKLQSTVAGADGHGKRQGREVGRHVAKPL